MDRSNLNDRLVLRAYRGPEDHPAMARVSAAVRAFNGDAELGSVADMDNHYAHLDQADLPLDCALVELDGVVVAYGRASWQPLANGDGQVDSLANVIPTVRGTGPESLLIGHALARGSRLIAERGGDRTSRIIVYVSGRDEGQMRALEDRGLRRVRRGAQLVRP